MPTRTARGRSPSPTPRGRSPTRTRQPKAIPERPAFRGGRSSQRFNRLETILSRCIASGPGLGTIVAGSEDTWFELRALEGTEPLDVAASRFQVSLKRQLTHRDLLPASQHESADRLPISVVKPPSGEAGDALLVRYSPLNVAGLHHLTVLLDGQHIRRSPFALSVVPGATAPVVAVTAAALPREEFEDDTERASLQDLDDDDDAIALAFDDVISKPFGFGDALSAVERWVLPRLHRKRRGDSPGRLPRVEVEGGPARAPAPAKRRR